MSLTASHSRPGPHTPSPPLMLKFFLEGFTVLKPYETESNNRSVMPLDALGRTRATMPGTAGLSPTPTGAGNPLKALDYSRV